MLFTGTGELRYRRGAYAWRGWPRLRAERDFRRNTRWRRQTTSFLTRQSLRWARCSFRWAACRAPRAPGRRRGCRVCCVSDASRPVMMCVRGGRGSTSRTSPRVGAARTRRRPRRAPAVEGRPDAPEPVAAVAAAPPPHQFAVRATRTTSFPRAVLLSLAARRRLVQNVLERPIVLRTH